MFLDGEPLGLDRLLPPLLPGPEQGLSAVPLPGSAPLPHLQAPVGAVAGPHPQVCWADLSGHTLVLGADPAARSDTLATLIAGLALTHTPTTVQFYGLAAGPAVADLAGLPHVGAVVPPDDRARTISLLQHLSSRTDQGVELYLVADCPDRLAGLGPELVAIADTAPGREVHLLLTAGTLEQVPEPLHTWVSTRVEREGPGSGRVTGPDGVPRRFCAATARIGITTPHDDPAQARRDLAEEVARHWSPRPGAPGVPGAAAPTGPGAPHRGAGPVRLGVDDEHGRPLTHDFSRHRALLVRGPAGSGKTTLLRALAGELVRDRTPAQVRLLLADQRAGLIDAVDEKFLLGQAFHAGALRDLIDGTLWALAGRGGDTPWRGPRLYLLVDNYVPTPDDEDVWAPVLGHLQAGHDVGVHLVLAEAADRPTAAVDEGISSISLSQALLEIGARTVVLGKDVQGDASGPEVRGG